MGVWQRWVTQPQSVWLRKAVFQIHLWSGLSIGLYIVMLSITGSMLVYRIELVRLWATPRPQFDESAPVRTEEELRADAQRAYPDHTVTRVETRFGRRDPTVGVYVEKDGETKERLFNPYTGEDLGERTTAGEYFLLWVVRLHDELLLETDGRWWNGAGSVLVTLLALTGAIVWWPGISRWRRSLAPKWKTTWPRFNWDLHSALGFWFFGFVILWGISGIYLGIAEPFMAVTEYFFPHDEAFNETTGDIILMWMARLHFGRWRSAPLKALWAVVGIVPALLFATAAIMWWNRVVRKRLRR